MKFGINLNKRRTETIEKNLIKKRNKLGSLIYDGEFDKDYEVDVKGKVKKF